MTKTNLKSNLTPQDRVGRAIAVRLDAAALSVPHDITERLKAARMQALAKRRVVGVEASAVTVSGGAGILQGGSDIFGFWGKLGSIVPLLALVVGMVVIGFVQDDMWAMEAAEVDAALLVDELPPTAYTDPGFSHFLRAHQSD